ncbi:hypothetical protein HK105_200439 [Polyrhizophydium stewartii]|uniref:Ankyrin repeat domain-containing protein n=1 Tax=Polyrhizophydium stewartii TaxID=2732419 RepID=A0ABR4NLF9_9FUNG
MDTAAATTPPPSATIPADTAPDTAPTACATPTPAEVRRSARIRAVLAARAAARAADSSDSDAASDAGHGSPRTRTARAKQRKQAADAQPADRLAAVVRDGQLDAAQALAALAAGSLRAGDLARLSQRQRRQLWAAALETDWAGDIGQLPAVPSNSRVFMGVASRRMFAQLRDTGRADAEWLFCSAMRNGWADVVDMLSAQTQAHVAARLGRIDVLDALIAVRRAAAADEDVALRAALHGQLAAVQWLSVRAPAGSWTPLVADTAARSGNAELVARLLANRTEGCSPTAMDWAAMCGHLDVVRLLKDRTDHGCSAAAMDWAAAHGHLAVVEFLHAECDAACTTAAMDRAAANGYLPVLVFLHSHRREGCTADAAVLAARAGHLAVVQWLHAAVPQLFDAAAVLAAAVEGGRVAVVQWVHAAAAAAAAAGGAAVDAEALVAAAVRSGHAGVLAWAVGVWGGRPTRQMLAAAVDAGAADCVEWLLATRRGRAGSLLLTRAAALGHTATVDVLLRFLDPATSPLPVRRPRTAAAAAAPRPPCSPRTLDTAARNGHVGVLALLHARQPMRCTPKSLTLAARGGHQRTVEWLLDNEAQASWNLALARRIAQRRGSHAIRAAIEAFARRSNVDLAVRRR